MRPSLTRLLLAVLLGVSAACSDEPITAPTPGPPVTDTFSGTLATNGAVTHPFDATSAGTITATLTSVAPDSAQAVGISLGTWNGTICHAILTNDAATQSFALTGTTTSRASLCVRMYDAGNIPADTEVTYTVTVVHP